MFLFVVITPLYLLSIAQIDLILDCINNTEWQLCTVGLFVCWKLGIIGNCMLMEHFYSEKPTPNLARLLYYINRNDNKMTFFLEFFCGNNMDVHVTDKKLRRAYSLPAINTFGRTGNSASKGESETATASSQSMNDLRNKFTKAVVNEDNGNHSLERTWEDRVLCARQILTNHGQLNPANHHIEREDYYVMLVQTLIRTEMDQSDDNISLNLVEDDIVSPPLIKAGRLVEKDCVVCMLTVTQNVRSCCGTMVCDDCIAEYVQHKIHEGKVFFTCPATDCKMPISKEEILARLSDPEMRKKFHQFLTNANAEPNKKTCPHCCQPTTFQPEMPEKFGHLIICEQCEFHWCFDCHSPNHESIKCKDNMKGLKALKLWTKESPHGQRNARKCPSCKVICVFYICFSRFLVSIYCSSLPLTFVIHIQFYTTD